MAIFRDDSDDFQRLDWQLLQNGAITLYHRNEILLNDVEWLKTYGYYIDNFDCSFWENEEIMHDVFAGLLEFPHYYGQNLDAFNDCLSDIDIPNESGRAFIFQRYDMFADRMPKVAWHILDIIENQSRMHLLFGKRLVALVQTDNLHIKFDPIGCRGVSWNRQEP